MLTEKEVERIAKLARIKISDEEKISLGKELSSALDYVKQLDDINTDGVEPLYQPAGLVNSHRTDEYRKDFEMNDRLSEKLVGQAPHKENRFIKVKSVLKK